MASAPMMMRTTTAPAKPRSRNQPAPPELEIRAGWAALIFFGLALVYFIPAFLPGRQIYGTDYLAGGYFFYDFIAERLAAGALPKWVPYVYGGIPLFANPGSTYHPVHLLADFVFPVPQVLAAVFLIHFCIAGVGMYLLARELGCRSWVALIAGVAFQFTGITMSWVYAGHDGRIMVATVAPLFFFFLHRGIRTRRLASFAGAAATLAFALLSFQIQNSYYLLLAGAIWAVFCLFQLGVVRRHALLGRTVALGLGAVAFGFLLASVNFLPFLDYVPESPRSVEGGRGYEYSTSYSMPPAEILSLAVPEQAGVSLADPVTGEPLFPAYRGENAFKLHTEYVGAFVIVLFALGAFFSRRDRYWWFFGGLTLFAFSIALGGHTPLYRAYYEFLPGTKQFRAPSLSFFVVALSLVSMAALTLERIAQLRAERVSPRMGGGNTEEDHPLKAVPWIVGAVVALAMIGAAAAAGDPSAPPDAPTAAEGWARFALFAGLVGGAVWLFAAGRLTGRLAAVALLLITLTDLWIIDRRFFHTIEGPEEIFAPDDVVSFLLAQPSEDRIWTFPFPRPYRSASQNGGNFPMLYDLEQAGGEHPNPLQRWIEYLGAGEQTYTDWHNFIAQADVVETREGQAIAFRSVPGFLDAANLRYIVSMAPLVHPNFREVHRGSALIYENTSALPRAYLVPRVEEIPEDQMIEAMRATEWDPREIAFVPPGSGLNLSAASLQGAANLVEYRPDRVVVRARSDRPALLVLADNYYEGWEAEVDGRAAEIILANNTFRGVPIPAGEHTVIFTFDPEDLYIGFWLYLGGFALLLGYGAWLLIRRRRSAVAHAAA